MDQKRRRIGLVVNPASAAGRGSSVAGTAYRAFRELGYETSVIRGASAAEGRAKVRRALDAGNMDALVLVGGDGLLHSIINERPDIPIGIVPTGSGNDFVRSLGIPVRGVAKAVLRIHEAWGKPQAIDLLNVVHRGVETRVAGVLSVGYDALVNRIANAIRLRLGPLKYQIGLVVALFSYRPVDVVAECDGIAFSGKKLLFSAALIPTIGGGVRMVPEASNREGRFRVFSVDAMPPWRVASLLPRLINASHTQLPEVRVIPGTHVHIDVAPGRKPQLGYGDGEHIGFSPFDVTVLPGALAVLA